MPRSAFAAALSLLLPLAAPALAEEGATLAATEEAYRQVDFEKTRELARAALRRGGHGPGDTKRLYALAGIAAAALESDADARAAFRRVLAIDPATRLEQNLSPKLRAPYLEARGALAVAGDGGALEASLERKDAGFVIELRDANGIAHEVALVVTTGGHDGTRTLRFEPRPRTIVGPEARLPKRFGYVLSARDEHDNRLFEVRGQVAPPAPPPAARDVLAGASAPSGATAEPDRTPYFVTAGVLAGLGVGALAGGVVAQLRREDAAEEWNGTSCEAPGQTRGEQCSGVDAERQKAETWAIGLYATGGALLTGSVVTLLLAPGSPRRERASVTPHCSAAFAPGGVAGACRARF
jgi:hypothetical protein